MQDGCMSSVQGPIALAGLSEALSSRLVLMQRDRLIDCDPHTRAVVFQLRKHLKAMKVGGPLRSVGATVVVAEALSIG